MTGIHVVVVAWRAIEPATVTMLIDLERLLGAIAVPHRIEIAAGDALVGRARSRAASAFLRGPNDVLCFLDSDIVCDPDDLVEMCASADDLDLVGGLYLTRLTSRPASRLVEGVTYEIGSGGVVPAEYLGAGCLAISRRVLAAMATTLIPSEESSQLWYPFFVETHDLVQGRTVLLGEDGSFTKRARDLGFHPMLDCRIRVGHVADRVIYPENAADKLARKGARIGFRRVGNQVEIDDGSGQYRPPS